MTQSTQHWSSQVRSLRDHFHVLTYDARGQGQSDVGQVEMTLTRHARDLGTIFEHLGLEKAHLVGFSHGARVALAVANYAPQRVERLILCSATAMPTPLARTIVRSWQEVLERGGVEAMAWSSLPNILGAHFLAQNERMLANIVRAATQRNRLEGVRALLAGMIRYPDLESLARNVRQPTLVISASEDPLVDREGATLLATLCHGQHAEIMGVGHTIPIEAPEEFRELVLDFLSRPL